MRGTESLVQVYRAALPISTNGLLSVCTAGSTLSPVQSLLLRLGPPYAMSEAEVGCAGTRRVRVHWGGGREGEETAGQRPGRY
eukprot:1459644-Rhodomonas_salina.1